MRIFYLIGAIVVTVFILILAFAQVGATCTWYLINAQSSPVMVLLQIAALGAIVGGFLVLLWKTPPPADDESEGKIGNE
ncbi:hypothetical protein JXA05_00830 [Candidatus Peregrinibacteria bacterium]|nr:hypothetical protein [Candidatus Peregrinibacteria bacterium]